MNISFRLISQKKVIRFNGATIIQWKNISLQGFYELDELQDKLHFVLGVGTKQEQEEEDDEDDNDDTQQQMRRFFGVA